MHVLRLSLALVAVILAIGACDTGTGGGDGGGDPVETTEVEMDGSAFEPADITVQVGDSVTWTNNDSIAHTVTAGTRSDPSDLFDSDSVSSGETFEHTFTSDGEYDYFCEFHSGMSGTVTVE